ncbi:TIGR03663 family protein [bacterium]|nr:MAG: TIGR03663 family protein [bacterium]
MSRSDFMKSPEPQVARAAPSDRYYMAATAILILAIVVRQWALASASMHPDENIHVHFSGGFANYKYDPIYHGPLLYHLVAPLFGIFGQNEFTARLVPSLLGIGLVAMVLGPLREFLGNRAALAGAAMIAISPSIVTYSRRLLHDSLVLFLTMGAVWCFLLSLQNPANTEKGRSARIGVAVFLVLFLATKANCFFIAAMLGAFYIAWWASGLVKIPISVTKWIPPLLFLVVNIAAIAFPRDNTFEEAIKTKQHSIFIVIALLSCVLFGLWLMTRPRDETEFESKRGWLKNSDATTYVLAAAAALWLYVFLFGNGAQIFIQWAQTKQFPSQTWAEGGINARSAISKMLEYWGGQQKTPRLPSRHDYYIVLALLYEVPIVLAALGGIWHAVKHRSTVTDLLLWWSFSSWTVYAVANEKVPWLLVHSMLPMALLGGVWLGQIRWNKTALTTLGAAGFLVAMRGVSGVNFERGGDKAEPMLYAQTPEEFSDAVTTALKNTYGDDRGVWLATERQWPSIWYLRPGGPYVGKSAAAIARSKEDVPDPVNYRAAISEEAQWAYFAKAGWKGSTVNFLIWPRASWAALQPQRYYRWFLTRDTLPLNERKLGQDQWKYSILAGKGEWSNATAIVSYPGP